MSDLTIRIEDDNRKNAGLFAAMIDEAWEDRRTQAAVEKLSDAKQQKIWNDMSDTRSWLKRSCRREDLDKPIPMAFVKWVRKLHPKALIYTPEPMKHIALAVKPGVESADPYLPDGYPEEKLYHGTRAWNKIKTEGLCAPVAFRASGDDYGWDAVWKDEVFGSWKDHLTKEQRKAVQAQIPEKITKSSIGDLVSLFWVSKNFKIAASYDVALEVDMTKIRYYWWFPDDVLGEQSYVLVMPTDCPQASPDAFKLILRVE